MTCNSPWTIPASGDQTLVTTMRDDSGAAVDLTGKTLSVVDVTGVLGSAVAVTVVDAVTGLIRLAVAWQGAWPIAQGLLGTFRLSMVQGADERVWPPSSVAVQGPALRLVIPRGSDKPMPFIWPDDREGASLTGETLDVVNASATLAPLVSVTVIDATTRECRVSVEGDLSVPVGDAGTFQLRRRIAGAQPRTMAPIAVTFQ